MSLRRHDTLHNTLRGIRNLGEAFKELRLPASVSAVQEEKDSTIAFLTNMLDSLGSLTDSFLNGPLLKELRIELHPGLSQEQARMGPFFSPWSEDQINAHPIETEKNNTVRIELAQLSIDRGSPIPGLLDGLSGRISRVSGLIVLLMDCSRGPLGESLGGISDWRHSWVFLHSPWSSR